jgi:RND superfamily putative drug exporter
VIAAAQNVEGVASGDGAVCLQPDYAKLAQVAKQDPGRLSELGPGCLPGDLTVQPRDGRTVINAQLVDAYDTPQAGQTVLRLRAALHPIPGAEAQIGGQAAINKDTLVASARHRRSSLWCYW